MAEQGRRMMLVSRIGVAGTAVRVGILDCAEQVEGTFGCCGDEADGGDHGLKAVVVRASFSIEDFWEVEVWELGLEDAGLVISTFA